MHFYEQTEKDIIPRHYVEMSSNPGKLRPTRITDVRKWLKEGKKVVPSVTTVINIIDKEALTNWKISKHLEQAHEIYSEPTLPVPLSKSEFIDEIKRRTELELDKAPSLGGDVHDALEAYFSSGKDPKFFAEAAASAAAAARVAEAKAGAAAINCDGGKYLPICKAVEIALKENCGEQDWNAEVAVISPLGYGGQIDLLSDEWVIDFKTKETKDKFKPGKMVYDEHIMQLAAYADALDSSEYAESVYGKHNIANVFICIETAEIEFIEHGADATRRSWNMFLHCLELWKLKNKYERNMSRAEAQKMRYLRK